METIKEKYALFIAILSRFSKISKRHVFFNAIQPEVGEKLFLAMCKNIALPFPFIIGEIL